MTLRLEHPTTRVVVWAGLSIGLPLIPVIVGAAMTVMQRETVDLFKLVDGIELFLISLWLVTATAWDLSRHDFRWEKPLRILLIGFAIFDLVFLVLIYIHDRVKDLGLHAEAYLTLALAHFAAIVVIAIALQLLMSYARIKQSSVGDSQ